MRSFMFLVLSIFLGNSCFAQWSDCECLIWVDSRPCGELWGPYPTGNCNVSCYTELPLTTPPNWRCDGNAGTQIVPLISQQNWNNPHPLDSWNQERTHYRGVVAGEDGEWRKTDLTPNVGKYGQCFRYEKCDGSVPCQPAGGTYFCIPQVHYFIFPWTSTEGCSTEVCRKQVGGGGGGDQ